MLFKKKIPLKNDHFVNEMLFFPKKKYSFFKKNAPLKKYSFTVFLKESLVLKLFFWKFIYGKLLRVFFYTT